MSRELVLVLGGARAGKSAFAEGLGASGKQVLFVATAEARDSEMARRIQGHRARRPPQWETLEEPVDLAGALAARAQGYDTILIDCLTLWVSNRMLRQPPPGESGDDPAGAAKRLLGIYERGRARWIVVSNEVGLGVVPPTELGRAYRDALGRVNQLFARRADKVYLLVAGLALELKGAGARPFDDLLQGRAP